MFGENDDVLNLSDHMHINAAILVFSRGGQALPIFNSGQNDSIGGDSAFDAVHPQCQPKSGREFINQRALRAVLQ